MPVSRKETWYRYRFALDAHTVRERITGGAQLTSMVIPDPIYWCHVWMGHDEGGDATCLYRIRCMMNLVTAYGEEVDPPTSDRAFWHLPTDFQFADIRLSQERPGECEAELVVESNPERRRRRGREQDHNLAWETGRRFASRFWEVMVEKVGEQAAGPDADRQAPPQEPQAAATTSGRETKETPRADLNALIGDAAAMRKHHPSYNVETASDIARALPRAWEMHTNRGGQWGPGIIAEACKAHGPRLARETVGRHLKAFYAVGITEMDGIPIAYRPRQR